ncbi:MAG: glycosyltransferase family 4 protein [Burkholderiales bacterium]|nr:glycosyltransferase family 4 protein [Burkholderiales bacterium]
MRPLRLCFVGWGDHVHVERWAGWFARAGHEVSIVTFTEQGRYPPGVRQYRVGLKGRGPRWVELKLRYLFARIKPDLVHVHWAHFAVPVRRVWRGPLVVSAWGSDVYRRDQFTDREWADLAHTLQAVDLVTCDSDDLATAIHRELAVSRNRVVVIQWGVDTGLFSPEGDDLRTELDLHRRAVVFSARNFTPLYNQENIVEAFAQLYRERPDAFLLMKNYGGDADYVAKIRGAIRDRGLETHSHIVETVAYEAMPALYRTADVTVSIPFSDATPMALLEAMACGCVPVVSNLPSLREWVVDGENGFLVDPRDTASIRQAMHHALAPGRQGLANAAIAVVRTKADQRTHMGLADDYYRRLMRN